MDQLKIIDVCCSSEIGHRQSLGSNTKSNLAGTLTSSLFLYHLEIVRDLGHLSEHDGSGTIFFC